MSNGGCLEGEFLFHVDLLLPFYTIISQQVCKSTRLLQCGLSVSEGMSHDQQTEIQIQNNLLSLK